MTTVRELCVDALTDIGILAVGEPLLPEDGAYAIRVLNRMLQQWNTEELMVYSLNRSLYSLVAGQQLYTFGTGGNFNAARPVRIEAISVMLNYSPRPIEIPLTMLTDADWQNIAVKTTPSLFPTKVWITGNYPLNSLYFWPVPGDSTVQVVVYSWNRSMVFTSLNDSISYPDGYEEAIITNLAVYLSGSYGVTPSPVLIQRAMGAKAAVQSFNVEPLYASVDNPGSSKATAIATFGYLVDR